MTHYALLAGAGGWFPTIATGGTISTQVIDGVPYNVHKFTSTTDFVIESSGSESSIEVFMWGGGGAVGGYNGPGQLDPGRNGGDGGGSAYAENTAISIAIETLKVCVGGGGTKGNGGTPGSAGSGVEINSTNFYFGGRGNKDGPSGFSQSGGGGGGASALIRGTTGLIVAAGGGGGGGVERAALGYAAGNGGGGGENGTASPQGAGGGTAGASSTTNGLTVDASNDSSGGGGGGGGVNGGGAGGNPNTDNQGGGGAGGGTSLGSTVTNGSSRTPGNNTGYNDANYGRGGGGGFPASQEPGNAGLVVIRYPTEYPG